MINFDIHHPTETNEQFRMRRRTNNTLINQYLRGRIVWDSKRLGTYRKRDHGLLECPLETFQIG